MNCLRFFTLAFFVIFFSNLKTNAQSNACGTADEIVNLVNYCSTPAQYTNKSSTNSDPVLPNCWNASATDDVWFWFTATAADIEITVSGDNGNGTIKQPYIELQRGTCGGLSMACSGPDATLKNTSKLTRGGLIPGTDYIIRISSSTVNQGTFKLCLNNYTAPLNPGADCDGAIRLCNMEKIYLPALSGGGKKKEIPQNSCFYAASDPSTLVETNSSWYKWTCEKAGTLTFVIDPVNPKNDLDFIVYELTNGLDACGPKTLLRCNATTCVRGATGLNMTETKTSQAVTINNYCDGTESAFVKYVDMVAGRSYALFINNFDGSTGFTITWGGSGTFLGPHAVITAGSSAEICKGGKITYSGNLSEHYGTLDWVFKEGKPDIGTGVGPFHIDYNNPGIFTTYLYAKDSTCASGNSVDSIKVTINGPPNVNADNPDIGNTDCNKPTGTITNITVSGGTPTYTYEWFKLPSTSVSTSTTSPDLNSVPPGDYYLIVTDSKSCKDSVGKFTVKTYDPPKTPGVSNNKPYCTGDKLEKITVNATTGTTYKWYDDKDLNNLIHEGTDYTPTNTVTDTLYLTATEHGCTSEVDTILILINPLPSADGGLAKHILCYKPDGVELEGNASGGTKLSYSWTPVGNVVSGGNTLKPTVKAEGTYTLTVKNDLTGCVKTDDVNVIKDPIPVAVFKPDVYTGENPLNVIFTNSSTGSNTYVWVFDKENKAYTKDTKFTYINPNTYQVLLISSDSSRCPDTAMVQIKVYEKFTVVIPNVFTPNGDGKNDAFTINMTGIESVYGEIYDRWGLKMFSWEQRNDGWDGRSPAGTTAPEGTYYFILIIKPQDGGKEHIEKGSLTLLR